MQKQTKILQISKVFHWLYYCYQTVHLHCCVFSTKNIKTLFLLYITCVVIIPLFLQYLRFRHSNNQRKACIQQRLSHTPAHHEYYRSLPPTLTSNSTVPYITLRNPLHHCKSLLLNPNLISHRILPTALIRFPAILPASSHTHTHTQVAQYLILIRGDVLQLESKGEESLEAQRRG